MVYSQGRPINVLSRRLYEKTQKGFFKFKPSMVLLVRMVGNSLSSCLADCMRKPIKVSFQNLLNFHCKGSFKCGSKRCEVCLNVNETSTFASTVTCGTYIINHKFNCNDKCLVYLLTCNCCKKQYVFQTDDKFRFRWNNYIKGIPENKDPGLQRTLEDPGILDPRPQNHFF